MDLKKTLLSEHSKAVTDQIIRYVGSDKIRFNNLMLLFLGNDRVLSQRASWPVGYIGIKHPNLLNPHFKKMIAHLDDPNIHDAIKRNTLRIFETIDIPEKYCSQIFDLCLRFISGELYAIAIRAFAITTATGICKKIPEFKNELKLILNTLKQEPQRQAIRVRIRESMRHL
jgi:hypothetical protein